MEAIVPILVLTLVVATFGSLLVYVSSILGPKKVYTKMKYMPYECGLPGQQSENTKVSVRYYLTAILFIVFDIEILFMYPWALTYKEFIASGHGAYIFWVMFVFIALFLFGLIWEVRSNALEWD
jgi:NADH-quinone oxidoreductase subunit A